MIRYIKKGLFKVVVIQTPLYEGWSFVMNIQFGSEKRIV